MSSLTIIGPMRLSTAIVDMMPREAANARTVILQRIETMEKVFHLIEEPDIRGWLNGVLPRVGVDAEDLADFYVTSGPNVSEVHLEVAEWIMQGPRLGLRTAAVFSGRRELCEAPAAAVLTLAIASEVPVAMLPHVFTLPAGNDSGASTARRRADEFWSPAPGHHAR